MRTKYLKRERTAFSDCSLTGKLTVILRDEVGLVVRRQNGPLTDVLKGVGADVFARVCLPVQLGLAVGVNF